jgi:hypothetical protein
VTAALLATPPRTVAAPTTTVGVEPIGAELRPLLTSRERRLSLRRTTHAVVARRPGDRPRVLGVGRDLTGLVGVAAELARTCAVEYVSPGMAAPGQTDACAECGEPAVVAVAEVRGRRVPYWQHVEPAGHSDLRAHAARVGVTS